jgi:T3SS negative regulator,GrlR
MMQGIYSAVCSTNKNTSSSGVAIFTGNAIHGGDASHYYRGKYSIHRGNQISATIDVVKYSTLNNSIFGPINRFQLTLNGIFDNGGFDLSGPMEGRPDVMITMSLRKMDELA